MNIKQAKQQVKNAMTAYFPGTNSVSMRSRSSGSARFS